MKFFRFNPRERKFLELYFSGYKMKTAARAAGYRGRSDQSLCNRGRRILKKFSNHPDTFFHLAGPREVKIARLIGETLDGGSEARQLTALRLLGQIFFP